MPLSEFYRMARGRIGSSQPKPTSSPIILSHIPDNNELVELLWENGQIMMQGQSSRGRRDINSNNSTSQIPRNRDLGNASNSKMGKYGLMGSAMDDFAATVPSPGLGYEQDDDMTPWLNYDYPLHNNYNCDFLPELSSVTINDVSHQRSIPSVNKKSIVNPIFEENQHIAPSSRSGVSKSISNNVGYLGPANAQAPSGGFSNSSSGIINFSHFSRPISLARADIHNVSTVGTAGSLAVDRSVLASKGNSVPIGNEIGSTSQPNLMPKMVNTRNVEDPETVLEEDAMRNDPLPQQVGCTVASKEIREGEKVVESLVASSVCSGNNPEQASDDQNHLNRKSRETDDSEGRSEDLENESVGIRKTASARGVTGAKRSRAAEVHNLSERRRRDRINEKMRALQELIPNCNKVDKASMLDEAIEYLKTLQLQVQIMSMAAGLFMPHMMLPASIQPVPGHMAHFPPMMGVGMGMGMGFGMGIDRFHAPQAMPFSGPANFQMFAGPNLPVCNPSGLGIPMPAPHQPSFSASVRPTKPGVNNSFGVAARMDVPSSGPLSIKVSNDQARDRVSLAKEVNEVLPS